jgi:hypothetical protein
LLCPFCRLEGGVLSAFFFVLHDSVELLLFQSSPAR